MDYRRLLEESYAFHTKTFDPQCTRLEFLSGSVFEFKTYDCDVAAMFAHKAVRTCAILSRKIPLTTHDPDYHWYLAMVNTTFFENKIDWGTSIRTAFWQADEFILNGLWYEGNQISRLALGLDEWTKFVDDLIAFSELNYKVIPRR